MAKSRRATKERRKEERRWKRWIERARWRRELPVLKATERLLTGEFEPHWDVWDHKHRKIPDVLTVDQSLGPDATVVITGSKDADGTYKIKALEPGRYRVVARVK